MSVVDIRVKKEVFEGYFGSVETDIPRETRVRFNVPAHWVRSIYLNGKRLTVKQKREEPVDAVFVGSMDDPLLLVFPYVLKTGDVFTIVDA